MSFQLHVDIDIKYILYHLLAADKYYDYWLNVKKLETFKIRSACSVLKLVNFIV